MTVIYVVLPLAFIVAGLGVWAFVWCVRGGQLDDLDTPAMRVATDDDDALPKAPSGSEAPER